MSNHVTKIFHKIWGGFAIPHKPIRFRWIDFLLVLGIAGLFYGLVSVEKEWTVFGSQQSKSTSTRGYCQNTPSFPWYVVSLHTDYL